MVRHETDVLDASGENINTSQFLSKMQEENPANTVFSSETTNAWTIASRNPSVSIDFTDLGIVRLVTPFIK